MALNWRKYLGWTLIRPLVFLVVASGAFAYLVADEKPAAAPRPTPAPAETKAVVRAVLEPDVSAGMVLVELHEGVPDGKQWEFELPKAGESFTQQSLALIGLPKKYVAPGVIADRGNPVVARLHAVRDLPAGDYTFLLRSRNAVRLFVDGKLVAQTKFLGGAASGHEAVPKLAEGTDPELRPVSPGHQEQAAKVKLAAGTHRFRLEAMVGGKKLRPETGEVCVALRQGAEPFRLLTTDGSKIPLTDDGWSAFTAKSRLHLGALNAVNRRQAATAHDEYWNKRHELARRELEKLPAVVVPAPTEKFPANNGVDHFINAKLAAAGKAAAPLTDDHAFLRRVSLDTVGVIPSPKEMTAFTKDKRADRRNRAIDRLLNDARWADHWVGYWQDVLAENPGILKPELNNTGPFRFWIHEAFLDGKPFDRFVTELTMMQGSKYHGGPAGFAMATQNDVPMAAKAHVLAQAFLGVEMKCARCHDAPSHPFSQGDLFHLAALLERKPISLPKTSTVPQLPGGRKPLVNISLKPGDKLAPEWSLAAIAPVELPDELLQNPGDTRERLAVTMTSPANQRFSQVIVNRLWKRYFGRGIVEPVDDWTGATNSHPELLDYLARELVKHDYDLKHVARLILNSHAYQRQAESDEGRSADERALFAGPERRRMTAEQVVDSLLTAAGKGFDAEELTLDADARRPVETFLNLGEPERAWQFTSLSNERDRPALALPLAQGFVDLLLAFGWRDARPSPLTVREDSITVLQPLTLANGNAGNRATQLSDGSAFTRLALTDQPIETLVEGLFVRTLSRPPSKDERDLFVELLDTGYSTRRVDASKLPAKKPVVKRNAVSWSNHLSAEATKIKMELERAARAGDPPTDRLEAAWRERMEDAVWVLLNSPEFVFVP